MQENDLHLLTTILEEEIIRINNIKATERPLALTQRMNECMAANLWLSLPNIRKPKTEHLKSWIVSNSKNFTKREAEFLNQNIQQIIDLIESKESDVAEEKLLLF